MQHGFHSARRIAVLIAGLLSYSVRGDNARADESLVTAKLASSSVYAPLVRGESGDVASEASTPSIDPNAPHFDGWPLSITDAHTQRTIEVRLYDETGRIDEAAAAALDELLCDARNPERIRTTVIDRRTLQLVFRAAYHFRAKEVDIVSAYRRSGRRSEGRHGEGRAIDFRLPNTSASALAAYLRKLPRVGVGLYTHPSTHFVHLDVRERSYHWLDASPPGVSWPLRPIGGAELASRDAAYRPQDDLPEGMAPLSRDAEIGADSQSARGQTLAARTVH